MQQIFTSIYDFFRRYRALVWVLFFGSLGLWGYLASRIEYKQDITSMLPNNKAIRAMNDVISHTEAGEQVVFMLSFKDTTITNEDSLIAAASNLQTVMEQECGKWIDTISMQMGGANEEALLGIFQNNIPLFLNEKDYGQLDSLLVPARIQGTLEANRKILISPASVVYKQMVAQDPAGISRLVWAKLNTLKFDPGYETYEGYLFSDSLRKLTFFLKPKARASETGKNSQFFAKLDDVIAEWEGTHPALHITYFGGPAVAAGNATQMRNDTIVTLSVTIILLLALTFYFFRRKRTPIMLLVPVLYGAAMGLGIVYLVQGSISLIALGAGAIILGLAIDFSIHFLSHARHAKDIRSTVYELAHPLTIGSFTTIAAFFSLRFVHTPILNDLGLFAAGSLTGAALCTLLFMPHFPLGLKHHDERVTIFDKMGAWRPEKNKWLLLIIVILTPVFLYFSFGVQFDSDLMNLNYLSDKTKKAQDEVSKANAFALSSIFLVAHERDEQLALQKLESVTPTLDSLIQKHWIRSANNPTVFIGSNVEQQRRIDRWNKFWTAERKQAVINEINIGAKANGFTENAFTQFGETISKTYHPLDTTSVDLLKKLYPGGFSPEKKYAVAMLKVPAEYRDSVFAALANQHAVDVTDKKQGATQLVSILNNDFQNIAIYSSLIVFFALLLGYGRIELALMSFLPLVISWIWILGIMALLGLQFNIVNIIISSLIFGLGDDYAIFTTDGLIERYKYGTHKLQSVRSAVYLSVATVIIGLGVLLLAKHPALKSIAFISVLGILCVLFISQTLQPFLFNWFIQNRTDKKYLPFTLWSFVKSVFAFAYFFTGSVVLWVLGFIFTIIWPFNKEKGKYYFHVWISRATWSMMYIMANVRKRIINRQLAEHNKPAVYIANHTSFLDILMTTMLHPKLVLLTNKWVWKSPVFGIVVRMAEYYPVAEGADDSLDQLQDLVNRGYSIVVFPEGTRSYDDTIHRFHKGAFYIAEKLKLDIVPLVLHGISYSMQKGDWLLKNGTSSVNYYPRIKPEDDTYGKNYSERAKQLGKWMRSELDKIKLKEETPTYFREQLIRSYTFKGPILEWYCRIKTKLEGNYEEFHNLLPREGTFYDLGCGYGFMTYMLHWAARDRKFKGVDYDEEKIETAQHNFLRDEDISFEQADLTQFQPGACDGIIIADVLHYLLPADQEALMERCVDALNPGGTFIIRDGIEDLDKRHKGTKLTEVFSTKVFGFNKTQNELHFLNKAVIESFAVKHGLQMKIVDNTKFTSNLIFVMKTSPGPSEGGEV